MLEPERSSKGGKLQRVSNRAPPSVIIIIIIVTIILHMKPHWGGRHQRGARSRLEVAKRFFLWSRACLARTGLLRWFTEKTRTSEHAHTCSALSNKEKTRMAPTRQTTQNGRPTAWGVIFGWCCPSTVCVSDVLLFQTRFLVSEVLFPFGKHFMLLFCRTGS